MQHPGANDEVEGTPDLSNTLDRQSMKFEVVQLILLPKIACMAQAGLADIDRRDPGVGLAKRILRSLRGAAAGDENLEVRSRTRARPRQMKMRAATHGIFV